MEFSHSKTTVTPDRDGLDPHPLKGTPGWARQVGRKSIRPLTIAHHCKPPTSVDDVNQSYGAEDSIDSTPIR